MPLLKSKSKHAFKENIKREIAAGKPQKQAVAIAYSEKRRAKHAEGGEIEHDEMPMSVAEAVHARMKAHEDYRLAEGGDVVDLEEVEEEHPLYEDYMRQNQKAAHLERSFEGQEEPREHEELEREMADEDDDIEKMRKRFLASRR